MFSRKQQSKQGDKIYSFQILFNTRPSIRMIVKKYVGIHCDLEYGYVGSGLTSGARDGDKGVGASSSVQNYVKLLHITLIGRYRY